MDEYKQKLLVSFPKKTISKDAYIFGSFPYLIISWIYSSITVLDKYRTGRKFPYEERANFDLFCA